MRKHLGRYIASPLLSILIAILVVPVTASAARAQSLDRPWATVGFGIGHHIRLIERDAVSSGPFGYVGLRLPATATFSLGVEASSLRSGSTTHTVFSALAYVYPSATGGFFLKAGLGWAHLNRHRPGRFSSYTSALVGGLGHDVRVGERASLTSFVDGGLQGSNAWWYLGLALSLN